MASEKRRNEKTTRFIEGKPGENLNNDKSCTTQHTINTTPHNTRPCKARQYKTPVRPTPHNRQHTAGQSRVTYAIIMVHTETIALIWFAINIFTNLVDTEERHARRRPYQQISSCKWVPLTYTDALSRTSVFKF